MSKAAIEIREVSKQYRIFRRPIYRIADLLGLPVPDRESDEFWALSNVSIRLEKGERVGLIGRNGAGKSTLLKIIAGQVQQTQGSVQVSGEIQALMELGTGFHPEFSGRENVFSSLAYQGISSATAQRCFDDVVEFSELEDFINNPVKTYSAGMYARLAFAAATTVPPDILIIDEILGAGDAYFAGKSAKRMMELTKSGTTLLFVSHDISAVQMMCDRAIWLERGELVMDSDPIEVGKSYAASIRKQEELRLRAINLRLRGSQLSELFIDTGDGEAVIGRFVVGDGDSPITSHRIASIALIADGTELSVLDVGSPRDDDRRERIHLLTGAGYMDWSDPCIHSTNRWREFRDMGGQYKHAPFSFRIPGGISALGGFTLRVSHRTDIREDVYVEGYNGERYIRLGKLEKPSPTGGYQLEVFDLTPLAATVAEEPVMIVSEDTASHATKSSCISYGSGELRILSVRFFDKNDLPVSVLAYGEHLTVEIQSAGTGSLQEFVCVVCFYGMDGRVVTQSVSTKLVMTEQRIRILVEFEPLLIGRGEYHVSVGLFVSFDPTDKAAQDPIDVHDREYRFKVISPPNEHWDLGQIIHPVRWYADPMPHAELPLTD